MRNQMTLRYWVYSVLAALGALAMVGGNWWLGEATGANKLVNVPAAPTELDISDIEYQPLGENRQDVDVLLAIDFSGSMRGTSDMAATDPNDLRLQAAELMVLSLASDVFPRATQMGYLAFGRDVEIIQTPVSVEDPEVRLDIVSRLGKPGYSDRTNIEATLSTAYDLLFSDKKRDPDNIPAVVLLTDGEPVGGSIHNNKEGIRQAIRRLSDKGTVIFVVILRNPDARESQRLKEWRRTWKNWSNENPQLTYMEAQQAEELEGIYNQIRARLVNEGTKPGERSVYDPTDPEAAISMPPDLLQAHLLVGKPRSADVQLIAPDGTSFDQLAEQESRNEVLETDLYYRYRIYRPQEGAWQIETDSTEPLYYLLNPESLYSIQIAWLQGDPYINAETSTELPLVVIDADGNPVDEEFDLDAALLRTVEQSDGAIVEKEVPLPNPVSHSGDITTYRTEVKPELIKNDETVTLQVSGQSDDGRLANIFLTQLPVVHGIPSGIILQLPREVRCEVEDFRIWPPELACSNNVTATLRVQGIEYLQDGSLKGEIYPPGSQDSIPMKSVSSDVLQGTIGPLTSMGEYDVAAIAKGEVGNGLLWADRTENSVEVLKPAWVDPWRKQLWIGAVLLAICALWKPLIVALLLPIFKLLRLAPTGFYSEVGTDYSDSVYRKARRRRKLFTLTMGRWENKALDIRVDDSSYQDRPLRRGIRKILPDFESWLRKRPCGRLVTIPFLGLYAENERGLSKAREPSPMQVQVCSGNKILVCQSDWTDEYR
jgi:hypothetical protein